MTGTGTGTMWGRGLAGKQTTLAVRKKNGGAMQ